METVGVVAHRGGLLVDRRELTVGVVRMTSRVDGLQVELIARVPRELAGPPSLPHPDRDRLSPYEGGRSLRFGWLDGDGGVRWQYASSGLSMTLAEWSYRRFHYLYVLPPLFDEVTLVLAWPEIGFPTTPVVLPLPGRAEVERDDSPLWAPGIGLPDTEERDRLLAEPLPDEVLIETGTVVAAPVVLHGSAEAVVVLSRVTAVGALLALEVHTFARGAAEAAVRALDLASPDGTRGFDHYGDLAVVAVISGSTARWLRPCGGVVFVKTPGFSSYAEHFVPRPDGPLDLLVSWPVVGLSEVRVRVDVP
ncbi:hypothetical protein [Umezawaea sp. NPDC059074]|uniref:hypothetical protein n=1 Tax=Umezawaea sp. NPDC059074 TaxID=3346716 RepID=UPI0036BC3D58